MIMQNTSAWNNRKSEISVSTKQFGALKKGSKPGFFSLTEDHRSRNVLPQASVRGGTKFFSSGYFGQKRKKEKKQGTPGQLRRIGLFITGDEAWFEAACSLEEKVEGRKENWLTTYGQY